MKNKSVFWGAVLAGAAVALGAFGAHILRQRLEPEQMATFQTGVQYQCIHALGLIAAGILHKDNPHKRIRVAAYAFCLGIVLFAGSLYAITLGYITHINLRWMGAITPLGGLCFLAGWVHLALGAAWPHSKE